MQSKTPYQVVSLFSGCGGLDLGFVRAGFRIALALDKDPIAVSTYELNLGSGVAQQADLRRVRAEDIWSSLRGHNARPYITGVIGGPPCQAFSHGNVNGGANDGRRWLPRRFARLLAAMNQAHPIDFFAFENVRGITFQRHKKEFAEVKALFEHAGFTVFEELLDAVDYGVPQQRPRVFVIGFNQEKYQGFAFRFPPPSSLSRLTVRDAIARLPEPAYFSQGLSPLEIPYHPNHWTMNPVSPKFSLRYLRRGKASGRSFRLLSWDRPSWTVAYGHREVHVHPGGSRRLSVLEAMLLQGFPPNYRLLGSLSDQFRMVCDAVPPPLAEAIANSIRGFLEGDPSFRTQAPQQRRLL